MSRKGKRSPESGGPDEPGASLLPAFIIAPLGAENSEERSRVEYLEKQIAQAVANNGFEASLITSDGSKERITDYMIKRLTEDGLAIALMDDFNRNVMYEVAIRHALCLPTIHLVDDTAKVDPPFDFHDVELIKYPALKKNAAGAFQWDKSTAAAFRKKLQQRVEDRIKASPSGMFLKGLRKASASAILAAIFSQKRRELDILVRELRLNVSHLHHDYKPKDTIEGLRAKAHAELLHAKFTQIHIANDTLLELIEAANLIAAQSEDCSSICKQISAVTDHLAEVIKMLKNSPQSRGAGTKNARPRRILRPTCQTIVSQLEDIITKSRGLGREIAALHSTVNP